MSTARRHLARIPVMGCENRSKSGKMLASLRTNGIQEKL